MIGTVNAVWDERQGGEVAVQAEIGDAFVTLDDAGDFAETGGVLVVDSGAAYPYVSIDTESIYTADPVAEVLAAGTWIAPWSGDHEDTVRVAEISAGDGPPLIAVVPHALRSLLRPGTREPGEAETVEFAETAPGTTEVRTVRGKEPGIVGPSIAVPDADAPRFQVTEDGQVSLLELSGSGAPWLRLVDDAGNLRGYLDPSGYIVFQEASSSGNEGQYAAGGLTQRLDRSDTTYQVDLNPYTGLVLAGATYIELHNYMGDPATPPSGRVRLFVKLSAGVSKLFAIDDGGGVHALW